MYNGTYRKKNNFSMILRDTKSGRYQVIDGIEGGCICGGRGRGRYVHCHESRSVHVEHHRGHERCVPHRRVHGGVTPWSVGEAMVDMAPSKTP